MYFSNMMKKTLLMLSLLLAAGTAFSQVVWRYGADMDAGWGDAGSIYTPYAEFPAAFAAPYAGCQLTRIRVGLQAQATNVYVYIKQTAHDAQPLYRQKIGTLEAGWNEIVLDTPFDITADGLAIGYKANFASAGGVGISREKYGDGDIVYYNSQSRWTSTGGSVALQAVVEGDALPQNELLMGRMQNQTAPYEADSVRFLGTVRNVGGNAVSNYALAYTLNGGEEQTVSMERTLDVNATDTFAIRVPASVPGQYQLRVWVKQVNGQDDAYAANNEATATLTVKDPAFQRRVVCEEFTGTWCGWCPRGMVGLELMAEQHPASFIPISIHGSGKDPLEIDSSLPYTYAPFIASMSGAPSCMVNRKMSGDPFYDIQMLYGLEQTSDAAACINTTAQWHADGTAIDLHTEFWAATDLAQADYSVAYVLTEDSLTGYSQANYYSGGSSGEFYGWEQKENPTTDFFYNDVARGIFPTYEGEEVHSGQLPAGEVVSHDFVLVLAGGDVPSPCVNRLDQLKVTALLIDRRTGYLVNACRVVPTGDYESSIASPRREAFALPGTYTLSGQRTTDSRRGLYIVVTEDGQTKKQLKH